MIEKIKNEKTDELIILLKSLYDALSQIKIKLSMSHEETENKNLEIDEDYISLMDFYIQTKICHPTTLARICGDNDEMFDICGIFEKHRYYVKPLTTANYLAVYGSDKVKKKAQKYLRSPNLLIGRSR